MFRQLQILFLYVIIGFIYCDAQDESSSCPENSSFDMCGTLCEPSCTNPQPEICPAIACTNETRDCRCDSGFLRDLNTQTCVPSALCRTCPPGQVLLGCGRTCEGTCQEPYEPEICQRIRCFLPGCGCDLNNSMVRDNSTGTCIKISQCPHVE